MTTIEHARRNLAYAVYPTTHDHADGSFSPAIMVNNICYVDHSRQNRNEFTVEKMAMEDYEGLMTVFEALVIKLKYQAT